MKHVKFFILSAILTLPMIKTFAQANANINVLTLNSGQVGLGGVVDIQVTVGNTGPVSNIGVNKVRAQISIPTAIASALPNAQQTGLPAGWTILTNTGGVIQVCNGSDVIPVGGQRQVFIKVQGNSLGGPSTVSGVLSFGPGTGVCTGLGTLSGNITADDISQSTLQVVSTLPVNLADFSASLINCKPVIRWKTETEVNSDRFELERTTTNTGIWSVVGSVPASGNSTERKEYSFSDLSVTGNDDLLYRLKMIDKDGRIKYSGVIRVYINCKETKVFIYPNPVQEDRLYISLTGEETMATASLYSLTGQLVLNRNIRTGTSSLDVSALAGGSYILKIETKNGFSQKTNVFVKH
ncbi:MAG: T9SS type A sorting domain-containing protein [Bacteroidetes bacterium]|nr:T9SS type A sorting domain-containing protein [Bacteroidota bacterium]